MSVTVARRRRAALRPLTFRHAVDCRRHGFHDKVEKAAHQWRESPIANDEGDVDAIASLYAPDAVFMAQHLSPTIGQEQIAETYRAILKTIRLEIAFEIDEVVVVSQTVAYARTRSAGTTTILANGAEISEGNQELFILVRANEDSDWLIGRYLFSTTTPRS